MTNHETREAWLNAGAEVFRGWFEALELKLPETLRLSVGFPVGSRKIIGQCWHTDAAADGSVNAFVSPVLDNPVDVLAVELHELVHAALGSGHGHGATFGKYARGLGLTGKMTATVPTPELKRRLEIVADGLGPYPHSAMTIVKETQSTRMLLVTCGSSGECHVAGEFKLRMTRKWLDMIGPPVCPVCREQMIEV